MVITSEISKNLTDLSPLKYKAIMAFTSFCCKCLRLDKDFCLYFLGKKDFPQSRTLASYNPENNDIVVRTEGRAVMDIFFSIAHELVHFKQMENDELVFPVQDIGGKAENEANAVAGMLRKMFVKKYNARVVYSM